MISKKIVILRKINKKNHLKVLIWQKKLQRVKKIIRNGTMIL